MRLVIDPGHGVWKGGPLVPEAATGTAWVLQLALNLARRCEAQGSAVVTTRTSGAVVPRLLRQAYAREFGADVVLSLEAGAPLGPSISAVRFASRWWQPRRAHALCDQIQAALRTALAVRTLPGRDLRIGGCAGMAAPWRSVALLIMAHPPANPSPGDRDGANPDIWAQALADGLSAFDLYRHTALWSGIRDLGVAALPTPLPAPGMGRTSPSRLAAPPMPTPEAARTSAAPPGVLLIPGLRQAMVGAPLLTPRGFASAPADTLPTRSSTSKGH